MTTGKKSSRKFGAEAPSAMRLLRVIVCFLSSTQCSVALINIHGLY